jgi:ABC-2 type transport system permease protein
MLSGFIQNNKIISTVMQAAPQSLTTLPDAREDYTVQKDLGVKRSMIDYYSVTMVVMIALMSMLAGSSAFLSERQNKTINRLIAAPQNRVSIFLQKVAGMIPQTLLQITVIMGFSILVFGANYGATLQSNLYLFLLFFVITFCMISLGVIFGLFIKSSPFVVIMPVLWLMMFFGGTYSKEVHIEGFSDYLPNYLFQQAAYDVAIFGRYDKANHIIVICLGITILALAIGAWIFSRKREE